MFYLNDNDLRILRDVIQREKARSVNQVKPQPTVITPAKNRKLGKTDAAIDKGNSGNVSIYTGTTKGSESGNGVTVSAYNRFGDLGAEKWVFVEFIGGSWEIYQGEC